MGIPFTERAQLFLKLRAFILKKNNLYVLFFAALRYHSVARKCLLILRSKGVSSIK